MATFIDVVQRMVDRVLNRLPILDVQDDTIQKDVYISVPALEIDREDRIQEYVRRTSSTAGFIALLDDEDFIECDRHGLPDARHAWL